MKPFLQTSIHKSTIENWKQILADNDLSSFGLFAYATDSGVAQIITYLSDSLPDNRRCRWVLGFDYGRSQPTAIKKLAEIGQSEIRIYDGNYVVKSTGFVPRKSYHLKTVLTLQKNGYPCKQLIGSGNLSASGLLSGIEAGCVVDYSSVAYRDGKMAISGLEEIWEEATPFEYIIDEYEKRYNEISFSKPPSIVSQVTPDASHLFWIDVGYVTKNRGPNKPGNQFDLPKGSHVHLGLQKNLKPIQNSTLGELRIRTPVGDTLKRTLRFGNNSMEKLTLPIPERYGYQCYDGKILTFKVEDNVVELEALEYDDFFRIYGRHISAQEKMQSGRLFGFVQLNKL